MSDIVVIGSINMDLVIKAHRAPLAGETLPGEEFHFFPGGKGANQAVAAARLGGKVAMVGRVGNDIFGRQLTTVLNVEKVDTSNVHSDPQESTGTALIVVEENGENRILIVSGANGQLSRNDIDLASGLIAGSRLIIMQFEIPLELVEYTLGLAHDMRIPVLLNPAPAFPISFENYKKVTYLVLNESEANTLAGIEANSVDGAKRAAETLMVQGATTVILTLGARGCVLANKDGIEHFPAFPIAAIDTTAAGDAFIGGFASAVMEHKSMPEAIRFASAAGALATTKLGAQNSLPCRNEVLKFLNVCISKEKSVY